MKNLTMIGTILVLAGILGFVFGGFSWSETESVAEIGDVQLTNEEEKSISVPPIASGLALGAGLLMIVVGATRKS